MTCKVLFVLAIILMFQVNESIAADCLNNTLNEWEAYGMKFYRNEAICKASKECADRYCEHEGTEICDSEETAWVCKSIPTWAGILLICLCYACCYTCCGVAICYCAKCACFKQKPTVMPDQPQQVPVLSNNFAPPPQGPHTGEAPPKYPPPQLGSSQCEAHIPIYSETQQGPPPSLNEDTGDEEEDDHDEEEKPFDLIRRCDTA